MISEYIDDIDYIDQYYQNPYDSDSLSDSEEENEKNILWSSVFNQLCYQILEIIYYHRNFDSRFDYLNFDSIFKNKRFFNTKRVPKCTYLDALSTDIHEKIQYIYRQYYTYIENQKQYYKDYKDSEYSDFKFLIEIFSYSKKKIYNNLLNELNRYYI